MKISWLLALFIGVFSPQVLAADGNLFSAEFAPVVELVVGIGYLMDILLVISGLLYFKKNSENPQQFTIQTATWTLVSGVLLLSSAWVYSTLQQTVIPTSGQWSTDSSVLAIDRQLADEVGNVGNSYLGNMLPESTAMLLLGFVYIVGLIAFIRGIYLLKNVGSMDQNSGGTAKALTHMVGGFVTMNILEFSCLVGNTLGISMLCAG